MIPLYLVTFYAAPPYGKKGVTESSSNLIHMVPKTTITGYASLDQNVKDQWLYHFQTCCCHEVQHTVSLHRQNVKVDDGRL